MAELTELVGGVDFGEGPRWHDGRLWYSDFYQASIYAVDTDGTRTAMFSDLPDRPSGLGWMPDGSLLAVAMTSRQVWREVDGQMVTHADLSEFADYNCNDMVVTADGAAYVGNFGFDLEAGDEPKPTSLLLVRPDGSVEVAADEVWFPNGAVITPDDTTLIVGETFAGVYSAWTIGSDGTLTNRRTWAEVSGTAPDGCTLDSEGAIWFADALGQRLVRVHEGGEISAQIPTPMGVYACMLGGPQGTTLFALCAAGTHPDEVAGTGSGAIYMTEVDAPRAGRP